MGHRSFVRRIVRNDYAFTVLTKIAAVAIGLIASSISKRFLGPAIEGEVGYIDSILTIVAVAANLGLYQPYPYYKRQNEPEALDKFLNIFALQFFVYTTVGMILATTLKSTALLAVCVIAPFQVLANQLSFMIMVEDVKYKNVVFFSARILNTLFILLAALLLKPSLWIALTMYGIGNVLTIVLTVWRFKRFGNPLRADLRFLRKILWFGIVSMVTTILLTINYQVDMLMLKWMGVSDVQRGFYRTGASLAAYGWLIPDAFREVLFSRTAKTDAIDDVTFSLKINFYITMAMLIFIAALGKPMLFILFGERYLPAYPVTVALLVGVLSMSYFKLIGTLLLAQGKKGVYIATLAASAAVNIVANYSAIPAFGIMGAALASVLSYSAAGGVFLLYFVRTYHVPIGKLFVVRRGEIQALIAKVRRK